MRRNPTGASRLAIVVVLGAGCQSQPSEPQPQAEQAAAPEPAPTPATPTPTEPPAEVAPPEPSFAEVIAPLVGDAPPSAEDSKTAWTHYKAKNYVEAQRMFARASMFEPDAWKPPFNLACASAQAGDEAMTKTALREAVARDASVVGEKARADADLAVYRNADWFEPTLLGQTPGAAGPAEPGPGGAAYFMLNAGCGGTVRLADGKFKLVNECGVEIHADPNGNLFIMYATAEWLTNYVIEPISPPGPIIPIPTELTNVQEFAAIGKGQFWIAAKTHVGFYDGNAWRLDPVEGIIAREYSTADHVLVDTAGGVWVGSNSGIYRHGPSGYEPFAIAGQKGERVGPFYSAPNGDAWLTLSNAAPLHLQDGNWTPIEFTVPGHEIGSGPIVARNDGTLAMWLPNSDLLAIRSAAGVVHTLDLGAVGSVFHMTADDAGRLWIKSNVGIVVVGSDLRTVERSYPIETIPAFYSDENDEYQDVLQIFVRGAGPTLPPAGRPSEWVTGVLMRDGKPLAKAQFEMCDDPIKGDLGNAGTPCEGESPFYGGESGPDGSFVMTKVKPGLYRMAVQDPGQPYDWVVIDDIDCFPLEYQKQLDLGKVDARKR